MKYLAVALALAAACASAQQPPPAARETDTVERRFGLTLPDPYRWMEGEGNAEFQAWLQAQGQYTRTQLDASPLLAPWQSRLKIATGASTVHRLQRRVAGRTFFLRLEGGKHAVLMVRDADGRERLLLDPNAGAAKTDKPASITEFSPSPDGRLVAVNVDRGGSEITSVSLIEVDGGAVLPETLDAIWGEFPVVWFADGGGFHYTQMAPQQGPGIDPMTNMRVRMHRLGTPVAEDPVVLAAGTNPTFKLEPQEFPLVYADARSDWAVALASGARPEVRLCVAPKAEAMKEGTRWNCLAGYDDKVQTYALRGSTLYLLSTQSAPNGRILALDLSRPRVRLADAKVVLPASGAVLTGLLAARDGAYVRNMTNGIDSYARLAWERGWKLDLTVPFAGASYQMAAHADADGFVFTLQSWTRPRVAYNYDPTRGFDDLHLGASAPRDYGHLTATQTVAVSADGTRVPLSIIHRKDLVRDGKALAILDGYGAYGSSQQPYFDPSVLEWVEAGHVYAVAHVRGGGEKGEQWWRGGKGPAKHRGVEDFIACARQLVKAKYTAPPRLAAQGTSAGGVLAGGAITKAPAAFGAAVVHVGMLNPVRLEASKNGPNQYAEFGDPRTAAGYKALAAMDPTQRIRDRTAYPPVLLAVGINDSRVAPWNSGKFGARLAKATRSGKPVWFRTSDAQGHFAGSLSERAAEMADTYTFLEMQLVRAKAP